VLAAPPGPNGLYAPPPYSPYSGQPIIFFDGYANTTTVISRDVPRAASHLIVEAFPTVPGTATIQVVDANGQAGQLTPCTDSNGVRKSISTYTKFLAKGVMDRVAIQLTVISGAWSVWATFTDQASDRANYYDRNATAKLFQYGATVAPHSVTQRFSYTVPGAKKAYLESIYLWKRRETVAGTPGDHNLYIQYTPNGMSAATIAQLLDSTNAAGGSGLSQYYTQFGLLGPGDQITGATYDNSIGGNVQFLVALKLTEFDI